MNKFDNLEEIKNVFDIQTLPKLNHNEIESLKRTTISSKIESLIKFLVKEMRRWDSLWNSTKNLSKD